MKELVLNSNKIALLSDIHWGKGNNSDTKLDIIIKYFDWYMEQLKEHKIKDIIFLGDWFDNRTEISVKTQNIVHDTLKKIRDNGFNIYLIVGNHDIYFKDKLIVNSVNIFEEIDNVTIISEPTQIKNNKTGSKIFLFPWNTFSLEYGTCDLMMGHFSFQGAKLKGSVSKKGETIETLLKCAPKVYSGHFHLRNDYKRDNGVITTVGSPLELSWEDFENEKGIYLLDLNDNSEEVIINDYSPKHVRVYYSKLKEKIEKLNNIKGNIVEFVVDDDYKYETIQKIIKLINSRSPVMNCKVTYLFNDAKNIMSEMKFDDNSELLSTTLIEYMLKDINERKEEIENLDIDVDKAIQKLRFYYDAAKENGHDE